MFGYSATQQNQKFNSRGGKHRGIDYAMPVGTKVKAFLPGTVEHIGYEENGYGHWIAIRNSKKDGGMVNIYAHLKQKPSLQIGAKVKRGDVIGLSGNSGHSDGPHLHFEVRPGTGKGGSTDPEKYVAAALGNSSGSIPETPTVLADSGAASSPSSDNSPRSASGPKGLDSGASVSSEPEIAQNTSSDGSTLEDIYDTNNYDQTGNMQFLTALNSIRVQLGKYQQVGMIV